MGIDDLRPDQEGYVVLSSGGTLVRNDGVSIVQSGTGNTHIKTAGSVSGLFSDTTFDGGIGTTGYTVGDVVKALKNLGLLAS